MWRIDPDARERVGPADGTRHSQQTHERARTGGEVILDLQHISLAFGGVKALTDISFDVCEHEIRAIIGPNGAGKSSMLNVINGVYHPQQGRIVFRGEERRQMHPTAAARQGIARTFQNIALFKGMTVLDNIMTGRNTQFRTGILAHALWWGPARNEEMRHRQKVEEVIDFLEIQSIRKRRWGACRTACKSAWSWLARLRPSHRCCCWTNRWPA